MICTKGSNVVQIGINNAYDMRCFSDSEMLPVLSGLGFNTLQYSLSAACGAEGIFSRPGWREHFTKVRRVADDCGLSVEMTHPRIYHCIEAYRDSPVQSEMQERCFEATAILGGKWTVIHPQFWRDGVTEASYNEVVLYNRAYLSELCARAERYGVGVAFENIQKYDDMPDNRVLRYGWSAEHILDTVEKCGKSNVCACVDTGHANIAGEDPAAFIRACGHRVRCLHLHDNDGASDQHSLPYMAGIRWDEVLSALSEINYQGVLNLETNTIFLPDKALVKSAFTLACRIAAHMANSIVTIG